MTNPIAEAIAAAVLKNTGWNINAAPTPSENPNVPAPCRCLYCVIQELPYAPMPDAQLIAAAPAALARNWGEEDQPDTATLDEARACCLDSDRGLRIILARIYRGRPGNYQELVILKVVPQAQIGPENAPLVKTGRQFQQPEEFWTEIAAIRQLLGFTWLPRESSCQQRGPQFRFSAHFLRPNEDGQRAVQA